MPRKANITLEVGSQFSSWTVLSLLPDGKALCVCTCGKQKHVLRRKLRTGDSTSCGCQKQSKMKLTTLARYGVENAFQNEQVRAAKTATMLERYGVEYSGQSSILREKQKATMLERYGVETNLGTEDFKQKAKATYLEKYGTEHSSQNEQVKAQAEATNIERFGTEWYLQSDKARAQRQNVSFHLSDGRTILEAATECNVSVSNLYNILKVSGDAAVIDYCNHIETGHNIYSTELAFMQLMNDIFPDLKKYDRQPTEFDCSRRPDFRLEKNGKVLYINIDGLYYHQIDGKTVNGNSQYHFDLRSTFSANHYAIFQFYSNELRDKPAIIRSIILNYFGEHESKYNARQCSLRPVSSEEATTFFNKHHLMGHNKASKAYGLYHNDTLLTCISVQYSKKDAQLEISRFASLQNICVRGGLSKLLKHVEKTYQPSEIVSFCDLRYATGRSYEQLGFTLSSTTLGWQWTDFQNVYNRLNCRANMDNRGLTQAEHAKELKWHKIYDAGQAKYTKKY